MAAGLTKTQMDRLAKLASDTYWLQLEDMAVAYWTEYPEEIDPFGRMGDEQLEASIRATMQETRRQEGAGIKIEPTEADLKSDVSRDDQHRLLYWFAERVSGPDAVPTLKGVPVPPPSYFPADHPQRLAFESVTSGEPRCTTS
jgi:hypothetical protein